MAAKHLYIRSVIQGAVRNGPWEPIRSDVTKHGDINGRVMWQKAKWSAKQVASNTYRLTRKGQKLDEEAREWRAEGW